MGSPAQSTAVGAGWTGLGLLVASAINGGVALILLRAGRRRGQSHCVPTRITCSPMSDFGWRCVGIALVQLTGWHSYDRAARSSKHRLDRDSSPARNRLWLARYRATCCRATNHRQHAATLRKGILFHAPRTRVAGAPALHVLVPGSGVFGAVMICVEIELAISRALPSITSLRTWSHWRIRSRGKIGLRSLLKENQMAQVFRGVNQLSYEELPVPAIARMRCWYRCGWACVQSDIKRLFIPSHDHRISLGMKQLG